MGPLPKSTEGEPWPCEFEEILKRAIEPDDYLYTYESLPEPDLDPPRVGKGAGCHP